MEQASTLPTLALLLRFFTPTFDLNKAVLRGDMTQILGISIHLQFKFLRSGSSWLSRNGWSGYPEWYC